MYEYNANVIRVVDGDTIHADVDLGCDTWIKMTIRLLGIDAPKGNTPEGKAATEALMWYLPKGVVFSLKTIKDRKEKYGRYLGIITLMDGRNVNMLMIQEGHAVKYPA